MPSVKNVVASPEAVHRSLSRSNSERLRAAFPDASWSLFVAREFRLRLLEGELLEHLAQELGLRPTTDTVVWESLALGNLMIALASNRQYAFHSIGALGVIELTAPRRAEKVNVALKRLGVAAHARRYYALHATLDVKHSAAWNREVLYPVVASDARAARAIAEGALMRLVAGERCFARYRRELAVKVAEGDLGEVEALAQDESA